MKTTERDLSAFVGKDKEIFRAVNFNAAKGRIEATNGVTAVCLSPVEPDADVPTIPVFPDFEKVFPTEKPLLTIALSAQQLKLIADYACRHGKPAMPNEPPTIRFHFYGKHDAAKFEVRVKSGATLDGVLMPMRAL